MTRTGKIFKRLTIALCISLIGFAAGLYYESKDRNTVYVLNEAKFMKLVSVGLATADKTESNNNEFSNADKERVEDLRSRDEVLRSRIKVAIQVLRDAIGAEYSKYPVMIQKSNNQGYELYSTTKKEDITQALIIKVIGEDKWAEIGKTF